jgi:hypothetical protein
MAEVFCVYRRVKTLKEAASATKKKPSEAVAIISYDEKPGIQAIATTAPDLAPEPGLNATFAREFEYKRHGTVSLRAGIDIISGKVHALVRDCHRPRMAPGSTSSRASSPSSPGVRAFPSSIALCVV